MLAGSVFGMLLKGSWRGSVFTLCSDGNVSAMSLCRFGNALEIVWPGKW